MEVNVPRVVSGGPREMSRTLLIPSHWRDLIQMVSAMKSVEGSSRTQYIVYYGTEFKPRMPRNLPHDLENDDVVFFFRPSVAFGREIDGQAFADVRAHARKLELRFGPFSKVVISSPFGISSELVRYFKKRGNPEIVAVPEGLAALTEAGQTSNWEYVGWMKAARAVGGHVWDAARGKRVRVSLQPGEVIWRSKRVAQLLLYRPIKPAPEAVREVDLLVSMGWPPDIILPFQAKKTHTLGVTGTTTLVKNLGIFVHQPLVLDGDTSRRIFKKIAGLGVTQLVLKKHRLDRGWEMLLEAALSVFGPDRIEINEQQALAEELISQRGISVICSVSSTALLNAAYLFPDARVLAFTATIRSGASPPPEVIKNLNVSEKALRQYGKHRIEFV